MSACADKPIRVAFKPIKPLKKDCAMIECLRQLCLDLPEDPSRGGYLYQDWTLYQLMTSPLQPYKKLKRVKDYPDFAC